MNKIGESFAAKFVLYMLMLVSIMTMAAAGTVVACNLNYNWYSTDEDEVEQEIYSETAEHIGMILANYVYYNEENGFEDQSTVIYGEERATQFGYGIYTNTLAGEISDDAEWEAIREINPQLRDQEDVFVMTVEHSDTYRIDVFLGDIEGGGAPNEVGYVYNLYDFLYQYRNVAAVTTAVTVFASFVLLVILICAVGRRRDRKSFAARIPMDLMAAAAAVLLFVCTSVSIDSGLSIMNYVELLLVVCLVALVFALIITGTILVFAIQVKAGGWWRNTVIFRVCALVKKGIKILFKIFGNVNLVWKTGLTILAAVLINLIIVIIAINSYGSGTVIIPWVIGAVITAASVLYVALCMKRLQEGGERLAEGDMGYKIDTKGMFLDLKKHAENLNDISNGMAKAVDERLRSERFKTELITNVSHDIKTPITSIINYVDFLKKEDIENEKAREYIEVLDRQSQRLKKLTEDLVEASKAATGNVTLNLMPCDAAVMMTQAMGEYKEKAESQDLEMIMNLPEENISIMADGRSMWRVLDNLMNNICKYSQPGTRVYQTLEEKDGKALITYRNTSRYELNITGEELTERFVRGDSSRHTEGSGLGLSIAKNLVELQGGRFDIYIDGDLFKTIIEFDLI